MLKIAAFKALAVIGMAFAIHLLIKGIEFQQYWWRKRVIRGQINIVLSLLVLIIVAPVVFALMTNYGTVHMKADLPEDESSYVLNYIFSVNPKLTEGLRMIDLRESPHSVEFYLWQINWKLRQETPAVGMYTPLTKKIYIPLNGNITSVQQLESVWIHELGHHVWFYLLTTEERQSFIELHDLDMDQIETNKLTNETNITTNLTTIGLPSEYAEKSIEEDFADSFQRYFLYHREDAWITLEGASRVKILDDSLARILECENAKSCVLFDTSTPPSN